MTVTLTEAGKNALHGTAGFGADGVTTDANDQIDILLVSAVTLPATLVLMSGSNLNKGPVYRSTGPTVQMFAAVRVDQSDGTIDGWTADEIAALKLLLETTQQRLMQL